VVAVAGDGLATVSWVAPLSDGGSAVTGYLVSDGLGDSCVASEGSTSCTVSGLTDGDSYSFTVSALNAVGAGPGLPL
jgi:hypothetical protein